MGMKRNHSVDQIQQKMICGLNHLSDCLSIYWDGQRNAEHGESPLLLTVSDFLKIPNVLSMFRLLSTTSTRALRQTAKLCTTMLSHRHGSMARHGRSVCSAETSGWQQACCEHPPHDEVRGRALPQFCAGAVQEWAEVRARRPLWLQNPEPVRNEAVVGDHIENMVSFARQRFQTGTPISYKYSNNRPAVLVEGKSVKGVSLSVISFWYVSNLWQTCWLPMIVLLTSIAITFLFQWLISHALPSNDSPHSLLKS